MLLHSCLALINCRGSTVLTEGTCHFSLVLPIRLTVVTIRCERAPRQCPGDDKLWNTPPSCLQTETYINRTTARPWCPQLSVGYIQSLWDERLCDPGAASDMSHRLTAARWHDQSDSWYWCLVCIYLFSTINHDWLENQQCWNRLVLFPVSMNYYEAPGSPRLFVISVGRSVGSELPQPTQRPELPWRVQHCPEPHRCCWLWQKV